MRWSLMPLVSATVLVAAAFGLWHQWPAWQPAGAIEPPFEYRGRKIHSVAALRPLYNFTDSMPRGFVFTAPNGEQIETHLPITESDLLGIFPDNKHMFAVAHGERSPIRLYALPEVRELFAFPLSGKNFGLLMTDDPDSIFMVSSRMSEFELHEKSLSMTLWRRTRPESWWGIVYIPFFWLTLLAAAWFIWSILRDLRLSPRRARLKLCAPNPPPMAPEP